MRKTVLLSFLFPMLMGASAYSEDHTGPDYRIEVRIYESKEPLRETMEPMPQGAAQVVLIGQTMGWISGENPLPSSVSLVRTVHIAAKAGEEVHVKLGDDRVEYFERRSDGAFDLKKQDRFVGYELTMTVDGVAGDDKRAMLQSRIKTVEVAERERIEGVALDVGRPVIATREASGTLNIQLGEFHEWPLASAGRSTLLLAAKVEKVSAETGAPLAPAPPQYTIETLVLRFPDGAFPASTHPIEDMLYLAANPSADHGVRVVKAHEVPGLIAAIEKEEARTDTGGLLSAPRVTTLLAPASGIARQHVVDVQTPGAGSPFEDMTNQTTRPSSAFADMMKLPDIAWVMEQPGGKPALIADTITSDEQPRSHRGIILGFCPEELEDGRVRLAVAWHVHPPRPQKRGGILGLFQSVPEDVSPWHGHLAQELGDDESLLIGGRIPETRDIIILMVAGEKVAPPERKAKSGPDASAKRQLAIDE